MRSRSVRKGLTSVVVEVAMETLTSTRRDANRGGGGLPSRMRNSRTWNASSVARSTCQWRIGVTWRTPSTCPRPKWRLGTRTAGEWRLSALRSRASRDLDLMVRSCVAGRSGSGRTSCAWSSWGSRPAWTRSCCASQGHPRGPRPAARRPTRHPQLLPAASWPQRPPYSAMSRMCTAANCSRAVSTAN